MSQSIKTTEGLSAMVKGAVYKPQDFNRATFEKELLDFYAKNPIDKDRQFVVHTGIGGMEAIDQAIKDEIYGKVLKPEKKRADRARAIVLITKKLTDEDKENITRMLDSEDPESVELAAQLLVTKIKQYE